MLTFPAHVTQELVFDGIVKKGDRNKKVKRVQELAQFLKRISSS